MKYKILLFLTLASLATLQPIVKSEPTPTALRITSKPKVIYSLKSKEYVYITIDDGFYLNYPARSYIIKNKIPVTYFLVTSLLKREKYLAYYKPLLNSFSAGNHSFTHLNTRKINFAENVYQICRGNTLYKNYLGIHSSFYRPPYGYLNSNMKKALGKCGYRELYLWNKTYYRGKISPAKSKIAGGDVILLHTNRYLDTDLKGLLKLIKEAGLKPGYLNQR